jgi:hypothetical protein
MHALQVGSSLYAIYRISHIFTLSPFTSSTAALISKMRSHHLAMVALILFFMATVTKSRTVESLDKVFEEIIKRESTLIHLRRTAKEEIIYANGSSTSLPNFEFQSRLLKKPSMLSKRFNHAPSLSKGQVGSTMIKADRRGMQWHVSYQIVNSKMINLALDSGSTITVSAKWPIVSGDS